TQSQARRQARAHRRGRRRRWLPEPRLHSEPVAGEAGQEAIGFHFQNQEPGGLMSRSRNSLLFVLAALLLALSAAASASAEELAYNCEEDICLVNPDNRSDQKRLTETVANERNPVFSPNGNLIAYNGYYARPGN